MIPIEDLGPPTSDPFGLATLAKAAVEFLRSHNWCLDVRKALLAHGWDGIIGIYYFEIVPASPDVDKQLWVITGDLPYAYLVCETAPPDPKEALEVYVAEMMKWIDAVRGKLPVDDLVPVCYADSHRPVPPTLEFAKLLGSRLDFIEMELIPTLPS